MWKGSLWVIFRWIIGIFYAWVNWNVEEVENSKSFVDFGKYLKARRLLSEPTPQKCL